MGRNFSKPASATTAAAGSVTLPTDQHQCSVEQQSRGKKKSYQSSSSETTPQSQKRRSPASPWVSLGELTRRVKQHLYCYSEKHRGSPTHCTNSVTSSDAVNLLPASGQFVVAPPPVVDHSHSTGVSGRRVFADVSTSVDYDQFERTAMTPMSSTERQSKSVSFLVNQQSPSMQVIQSRHSVPSSSASSSSLSVVCSRPTLSLSAVLSAPLQLVRTSSPPTATSTSSPLTFNTHSVPTPLPRPTVLHLSSNRTSVGSTPTWAGCSPTRRHTSNVARTSYNRPHSRTSPYDRSQCAHSPETSTMNGPKSSVPTHTPNNHGDSDGALGNQTTTCHQSPQPNPTRDSVFLSSYCTDELSESFPDPLENELGREGSPTRRVQSPDLSLGSLASDDLMLDTGLSSPSVTPDCEVGYDSRQKRDRYSAVRDPIAYGRLESVTELSYDDLTPDAAPEARTNEQHPRSSNRRVDLHRGKFQDLDSPLCICPTSTNCDCKSCELCSSFHNRRRRMTASLSGSFGRFSLRRLRSRPRSISYSQASPGIDLNDGENFTHLGERTFLLLASDQRQMLQELQSVKTTLLRLRRLLSEDQWHLPVFHEQLGLSEPIQRPRSRPALPPEWLSPLDSEMSEPNSHMSSALNRSQALYDSMIDEPVSLHGKGDVAGYESSKLLPANESYIPSVPSSHLQVDSDVIAKLVESLSQLQAENFQLNVHPDNSEQFKPQKHL